jgi:hypothetical protein
MRKRHQHVEMRTLMHVRALQTCFLCRVMSILFNEKMQHVLEAEGEKRNSGDAQDVSGLAPCSRIWQAARHRSLPILLV